jgi:peptide/nickel transport system substrate-binding protein
MVGWPFERPDAERVAQMRAQYPTQVHPWLSGTMLYFMNTSLPPFDDVNVRQAVNLALDRGKLVDLLGGPLQAEATCQVLLPNTQGYRPYCPYTVNPNPGGTWTAPDGVKARQLVAASGKAGTPVTVIAFGRFVPVAEHIVSVLNDLGFKARLRPLENDEAFAREVFDPVKGPKVQSLVIVWFPDFPAASFTIRSLFTCGEPVNLARFCDPKVESEIKRILEIQQTDPAAAGEAWAKVERMLVDAAPVAAFVNQRESDFVSARVGNYQHHPEWIVLFDQLWVQ